MLRESYAINHYMYHSRCRGCTLTPSSLFSGDLRPPMEPTYNGAAHASSKPPDPRLARRRRRCYVFLAAVGLLILTLLAVGLVLAFTVFRRRDPTTTLVSASVDGVAPRLSFPRLDFDLNVTLRLQLRVKNPNYAGFRHAAGKSFVYYRGRAVGDADVDPGRIPARGSEVVSVRLTLQVDRFADDLGQLVRDALAGEFAVDVSTTVPGKVTFIGIIRRHAVATSECHVVVGFPDLKIKSQECKHRTKL